MLEVRPYGFRKANSMRGHSCFMEEGYALRVWPGCGLRTWFFFFSVELCSPPNRTGPGVHAPSLASPQLPFQQQPPWKTLDKEQIANNPLRPVTRADVRTRANSRPFSPHRVMFHDSAYVGRFLAGGSGRISPCTTGAPASTPEVCCSEAPPTLRASGPTRCGVDHSRSLTLGLVMDHAISASAAQVGWMLFETRV